MINILEYLENTAVLYPDKEAFADEHESITFSELLKSACQAGSGLLAFNCVRKPVPILMDKSVALVQMMMGVVSAGGFYVILDASQPDERLSCILQSLDAKVMISAEQYRERAGKLFLSGPVLRVEDILQHDPDMDGLAAVRKVMKDLDPLYVLFTSGSTGTPKGVVISHRSVIDFIDVFTDTFKITQEDVLGNQAPFDFDVSVKDIYSGLKTGASVQLIPRKFFSFPMMLLDFLEERKVTNLTWAVSALVIVSVLNGLSYKRPSSIRRIMFSGETMPVRHLNYWRRYYPDAVFVNLYGPTEITCNCTYYRIERQFEAGEMIPIGSAFPNEQVFLLDEEDREVTKEGRSGEICVAGTALALGYYRNPEQTAKAFTQNPLNTCYHELIYRTGDIGMYNAQGELLFTSRKDFQIKHMGHRIELGEIEAAIDKIEQVDRSCCLYDSRKNKIVCFYQGEMDRRLLSRSLGTYLPEYMIPNVFEQLAQLPVTKNGKIDRNALQKKIEESNSNKNRKVNKDS